jgi:hypothetical protein
MVFKGIHLPPEVLQKIYHSNFERMAGASPRPLDPAAIVAECERLAMMIDMMQAVQPELPSDKSVAEMVKSYFASVD